MGRIESQISRREGRIRGDAEPFSRNNRHCGRQGRGADLRIGPASNRNGANARAGAHIGAPLHASVPWIVQWFKTMTTNEYIRGVKQLGWTGFRGQLWQRNYYEHVIRTQESLDRIRQYIVENPAKWECDPENPTATIVEANDPWKSDER